MQSVSVQTTTEKVRPVHTESSARIGREFVLQLVPPCVALVLTVQHPVSKADISHPAWQRARIRMSRPSAREDDSLLDMYSHTLADVYSDHVSACVLVLSAL
jgi:hypothetical protein